MVENKQEKTLFSGDKLVNVGLCFRTLVTISLSRKVEKTTTTTTTTPRFRAGFINNSNSIDTFVFGSCQTTGLKIKAVWRCYM